jgi:hypothetical protein
MTLTTERVFSLSQHEELVCRRVRSIAPLPPFVNRSSLVMVVAYTATLTLKREP